MSKTFEKSHYKTIAEISHEFPDFNECEDPIQEHIMMIDNATKNAKEDDEFIKKYLGAGYITGEARALVNYKCSCGCTKATMEFVYTNGDPNKIVFQYDCNNCRKTTLVYAEKD